ncbi:MAG: hypothetical protein GEV03_25245 [Streptosporangiales bacterium]|nr:hypothetical protein [Streptosporangiales bacterium]
MDEEILDSATGESSPVFVDTTGRRRLRRAGYAAGAVGLLYAGIAGFSLLGGQVSPHTLLRLPDMPRDDTSLVEPGADTSLHPTSPAPGISAPAKSAAPKPGRAGAAGQSAAGAAGPGSGSAAPSGSVSGAGSPAPSTSPPQDPQGGPPPTASPTDEPSTSPTPTPTSSPTQ